MKLSVERTINFGFGLALAILLTIGILANKNTNNLKETNQWIFHTYKVLAGLDGIYSSLLDEHRSMRGYIITGDKQFLQPYDQAEDQFRQQILSLESLINDNSLQKSRLDTLRSLVTHTQSVFLQTIHLREQSFGEAERFVQAGEGEMLMSTIRSRVDRMRQTEETLLVQREELANNNTEISQLTTLFGSLLALLIVISAIIIIRRDIAERKRAEAELRRSEALYRTLASKIPDVNVLMFDSTLRYTLVEGEIFKEIGISKETLEGKYISELTTDEERLRVYRAVLSGESNVSEIQFKDYFFIVHVFPVWNEKGEVTSGMIVSQHVTKFKDIEKDLIAAKETAELASQAKSEFLANMSHEIRTPMNGIIGMAELLFETPLTDEQHEYAATIRTSGEVLLTIINDILDFSKIESGKMELEQRPFDLQLCIEDTLGLLGAQAAEKSLDLLYTVEPSVPDYIVGDSIRLRQILLNLVGNAIKFTSVGEVYIAVQTIEADGGDLILRFSVRDTGIGIPVEKIHLLFQSFSQMDSSTTRRYGGTGLGLVISKRLVEMMGGSIQVESTEGKGSTFTFTISTSTIAGPAHRPLPDKAAILRGKQVLLVDDNQTNLRILTLQAEKWGMTPYAVSSAQQALTQLHERAFDLAIIDMQMPEMNGIELARSIRTLPSTHALPLILLTSGNYKEKDIASLFAASTSKPVRQSHLLTIILTVMTHMPIVTPFPQQSTLDSHLAERFPMTILLAEDNIINQKLMIGILKKLGYTLDIAANGLEVLQALENKRYTLIFMDVQMPELDGLDTTRAILQQYGKDRPVIIAMTANAMEGDREQCIAVGMDDYISKPVMLEDIQDAIIRWGTGRDIQVSTHTHTTHRAYSSKNMIDYTNLKRMRELDDEEQSHLASQIIELFFTRTPALIEDLHRCIREGDTLTLTRTAHLLKGSCGTLGAHTLMAISQEIERRSRDNNLAGIEELIDQLHHDYTLVAEELKHFI